MKAKQGVAACAAYFSKLFHERPEDAAVAINYGIALIENKERDRAEYVLGRLCAMNRPRLVNERLRYEAVKFYIFAIRDRDHTAALNAAFDRVSWFSRAQRDCLICEAITRVVDHRSFSYLMTWLADPNFQISFTNEAVRKFYEVASSVNRTDDFRKVIYNGRSEYDIHAIEITELLYRDFGLAYGESQDKYWSEIFYRIKDGLGSAIKPYVGPFDAYRLSLQLPQRVGLSRAVEDINWLISLGDSYFHCYWPLGALREKQADLSGAVEAYHLAGKRELIATGQDANKSVCIPLDQAKITCIALSFNDAAMVEAFCRNIRPHCDEIIVNDGGSTDGTIDLFEKFSRDTGFPVHIIRDQQASSRDRNLFNKDGYRTAGLGGVKGFEADRRRSTTLMLAQYDYILLADLDDYFPMYPNMKTIVAANYGVDHIAGSKREYIDKFSYCDLYQDRHSAMPTLFRRSRYHVYSGISESDEYLAHMKYDLAIFATKFMETFVTKAYNFWHLKWLFDPSKKDEFESRLGVKYSSSAIISRPDTEAIIADARSATVKVPSATFPDDATATS